MILNLDGITLVLLIGASGSGKSVFARKHFAPTQILSSDEYRAMVSGDAEDQAASRDAFEVLDLVLEKRLSRKLLTVVDATNVQQWARMELLSIAARYLAPAAAIVFDLPEAVCQERNAQRPGRVVPADVVQRQIDDLRASLPQLGQDGFRAIYRLESPEALDQATVKTGNSR